MTDHGLSVRVVYSGFMSDGATDRHRRDALVRLGADVVTVTKSGPTTAGQKYAHAATRRLGWRPDFSAEGDRLVRAVEIHQPDIVWLTKPLEIPRRTMRRIGQINDTARLVTYSGDDYMNRDNTSRAFVRSLPEFDLVVTTKSYNVTELRAHGAGDVLLVNNAFEPTVHWARHPIRSPERVLDLSFVGAYEPQRASSIGALARAGLRVHIWGNRSWRGLAEASPNIRHSERFLADDAYADILSRSKISLGFLRKANRDLQTTRSVEIPACGALLLAERSVEHLAMLEDGAEAQFFSDDAELVSIAREMIRDNESRVRIATSGHDRIHAGPFTNEAVLMRVMRHLEVT